MHADPSDPLLELLGRAADDPTAPAVVGDLASRARRKARRRARRRAAAVAAVSAGGMLLAVLVVLSRSRGRGQIADGTYPVVPVHPATAPADPDRIRVELASLNAEATGYQRAANELRRMHAADEQARHTAALLAQPDAIERIAAARQRAAAMLVREAEQEPGGNLDKSAADESYRRAARLFPDTPAGRLAAGRLKTPVSNRDQRGRNSIATSAVVMARLDEPRP
jgi:hypothetical protein